MADLGFISCQLYEKFWVLLRTLYGFAEQSVQVLQEPICSPCCTGWESLYIYRFLLLMGKFYFPILSGLGRALIIGVLLHPP